MVINIYTLNLNTTPLSRVISADGRESDTQHENDYLYTDAPAPGTPNASNVRAYTRNYVFDKIGNILQVKQLGTNGFTRNFTYNAGHNTLQKVETPTPSLIEDFTYDACGNLLTAGTTRKYTWNAASQLIIYCNQAGSSDSTIFAQYDYSGMNRVSKLIRTGTNANPVYERTIYIDGIFEYCILENGSTYEKNYVHVMDNQSRIAMVRTGTPFPDDITDAVTYNLEDQIGSSIARLNTIGTIIDREEYYPFGDSSLRTFTKKRYQYVGREKDLESGLYYYGARYYLPWTCRFISIDPLARDYPFYMPYNYAGNKPINSIDIDGMQGENEQKSEGSENSTEDPDSDAIYRNTGEVEVVADKIKTSQVKEKKEKTKGRGWKRFWGAVKAVAGVVEGIAGAALIVTGIGAPLGVLLVAHGEDVVAAGIIQTATGEQTETLTYQGIYSGSKKLGASDEVAQGIAGGIDGGISSLGGGAIVRNTGTISNTSNASKVATSVESAAAKGGFSVNPSKFDYFFGRVVSGSEHNIARSAQNLKDLTTLGIKNESQLMKVFGQALDKWNSYIN